MDVAYPNGEKKISGGERQQILTKDALITFSASVEGRNITRAMSPMGKGIAELVMCLPFQYHQYR